MNISEHYPEHVKEKNQRAKEILKRLDLETMVIHSGKLKYMFQDDMPYPFKCNPMFKTWLPLIDNPNCWLIINGENKPTLLFYQPVDFWHSVPKNPTDYWVNEFNLIKISSTDEIEKLLPADKSKSVYLGEFIEDAKEIGFSKINDKDVLNYLYYHRAYKSNYEFECIRNANKIAVKGHKAAKDAFYSKASEFEIQLEYLKAVLQSQTEVPYETIIGLNQNAAILHYTTLERQAPSEHRSLLIDAGANFNGYAADITRTYSFDTSNEFSELIEEMNKIEIELVKSYQVGESYTEAHIRSHKLIANTLSKFNFINLDGDSIYEKGLVKPFYPHGLGHHLGSQVHDLGANLADDFGSQVEKPKDHPHLRAIRTLEPRMVYTCEPGLYFIDSLLSEIKESENTKYMNWDKIESFKKFGGIRIEDNIILHKDRNENITRDLGLN